MIFAMLISLGVLALVVMSIVRLISHPKGNEQRKPITLDEFKKVSVGTAIAILLPLFINLTTSTIAPDIKDATGFALSLILSLGGLAGGYFARRNIVVGGGVITGSLISLLYSIGIRFNTFDIWTQLIIVGIGLICATFIAYFMGAKQTTLQKPLTQFDTYKNVVSGIIIFSLAILFASTANNAFNPNPSYPSYQSRPLSASQPTFEVDSSAQDKTYKLQQDDYQTKRKQHDRNSFVIILSISLVYIILGLLIHQVGSVSVAFILAGISNIIYILFVSFAGYLNCVIWAVN